MNLESEHLFVCLFVCCLTTPAWYAAKSSKVLLQCVTFFTGRVRVLHGGCRSAPQRARFGSWALWWSAIADMRAGAGQVRPGPSFPVPPVPLPRPWPGPAVQASHVAVSPGQSLMSTLAPHASEAHAAEACQNVPVLPVLNNHPHFIRSYINTPRTKAACKNWRVLAFRARFYQARER